MLQRLQKILSQAGVASRREAEKMIQAGRVKVNGTVVSEMGAKVEAKDIIVVDGKKIMGEKLVYVLFNKPKGVVTTLSDPDGRPTVRQYLPDITERVVPVGRLDYNTEGLLILTNDGELVNMMTHPRHHVEKTYRVKVRGLASEERLDRLRIGLQLEDGPTVPAIVDLQEYDKVKGTTTFEITIHEGRNRQVRRMCEAIGFPVRSLKRVKFGFLTLEDVSRGQYRLLTTLEVDRLKKMASRWAE